MGGEGEKHGDRAGAAEPCLGSGASVTWPPREAGREQGLPRAAGRVQGSPRMGFLMGRLGGWGRFMRPRMGRPFLILYNKHSPPSPACLGTCLSALGCLAPNFAG